MENDRSETLQLNMKDLKGRFFISKLDEDKFETGIKHYADQKYADFFPKITKDSFSHPAGQINHTLLGKTYLFKLSGSLSDGIAVAKEEEFIVPTDEVEWILAVSL